MSVRKKSKETLEQQKSSFLNFACTQKKYESIIAELFLMDDEKIDDINYIKDYLKWKWIDGALVDNFEDDYKKYLKNRYFYWPIDQYPPELQSKIIKNNKILEKLKKEIVEDYKKVNDFDLIVSNKKFEEFIVDEIWYQESFSESKNINDDVSNIEKIVKEKNDILESVKQKLEQKGKEYEDSNIISLVKKIKLKKEINSLKDEVTQLQDELSCSNEKRKELCKVRQLLNWIAQYKQHIQERKWGYKSYTSYEYERDPLMEFIWLEKWYSDSTEVFNESFDFSETGQNNYKDYCKDYLLKIAWKLKLCSLYITYEDFYKYIINPLCYKRKSHNIYGPVKDRIESLKGKINEYLNYFFFWENKNINCIYGNRKIPTVFSWEKIDEDILNIIKVLKNFETDFNFDGIDQRFMDDLFIHRSNFRVLDEILEEWWLISHNEIKKRRWNEDIANSNTTHPAEHKDIYLSRGFNTACYWGNPWRNDTDVVFYVNTMRNFALNGYWIPLNLSMQPNTTIEGNHYTSDGTGFSIISESSLDWYNYWKFDVKDFYIFVSEYKKAEIENNPKKYNIENAHIIYIPKEYYARQGYTYKIYEFIEQEMEQFKQNKKIFPHKVIENKWDKIGNTWNDYLWAFCITNWDENNENNIPNLLWDWNITNIINLLKNCSSKEDEWFIDEIEEWLKNTSFEKLQIPKYFPTELYKLAYSYLKIDYTHRPRIWSITAVLSKSWYSQKEIAIFHEIVSFINASYKKEYRDLQHFCDAFLLKYEDVEKIIMLLSQNLWFYGVSNWLVKSKEVCSKKV